MTKSYLKIQRNANLLFPGVSVETLVARIHFHGVYSNVKEIVSKYFLSYNHTFEKQPNKVVPLESFKEKKEELLL